MEGELKSEIWITSALTESDVPNAVTLCVSLKRVQTCRKIGVILSKKLSTKLVEYLRQRFDYSFFLEDEHNMSELKEQDFVKLFPLTLDSFEMCVFLTPTMMAVKNCDQIFGECQKLGFSGYLFTDTAGMDVTVIKPSRKVFENVMKDLVDNSTTDVESFIRKWTDVKNNHCGMPLSESYQCCLTVQGVPQSGNENDVLLVNTRDLRLDMNSEELGIFPKLILKQWKLLYRESVQPILHLMQKGGLPLSDNLKFLAEISKPTTVEVNNLMLEDCQLPENIKAQSNQSIGSVKDIKRVLLTGATGSFGPYVLKELTNLPQIGQVICLMRHSNREAAEERLQKVLSKLELLPLVDMGKIKCVSGNVAESHLGMEPSVWEDLSQNIDAVFHCAAKVNHTGYYRKTSSNRDMRAVNVGGTKNVLEFACKNKLKHVYHASSVLAFASIDENGRISEKWPEVGDFDGASKLGYPVSKFVGDVLINRAVERGIPCKVFRFPIMSGESKTGRCSIATNHLMLRFLFIMTKGVMNSEPFRVQTLPVDICADVSFQIFFNENAGSDLYNINHGCPDTDQEFEELAKEFGYNLDKVEFSEFVRRILESGREASALVSFKEFYRDEEEALKVSTKSPILGVENEGRGLKNKWWSEKVVEFVPNFFENQKPSMDYVRQDLLFCKRQGLLERFGL